MTKFLIGLMLLALSSLSVRTQVDLSFSLIQPSDIFTDEVEIIEASPQVSWDGSSLFVFENGNWQEYAYPQILAAPGAAVDVNLLWQADGNIRLTREFPYAHPSTYPIAQKIEDVWIYDPITAEFSHPELVCGQYARVETGQGFWVVFVDAEGIRLCHIQNGELSPILPRAVEPPDYHELYFGQPFSPDRQWFIHVDKTQAPNELPITAHNLLTGDNIPLGTIERRDSNCLNTSSSRSMLVEVVAWGSNNDITLKISVPSVEGNCVGSYALYTSNITQPNSLKQLAFQKHPFVYENERFLWSDGENDLFFGLGPYLNMTDILPALPDYTSIETCSIQTYDVATGEIERYYTPSVCGVGTPIPESNGEYLYSDLEGNCNQGSVDLVRFKPEEGVSEKIFSGEIEDVINISPGGRYAILLTDDDGRVNNNQRVFIDPATNQRNSCSFPINNPKLSVLDLIAKRIVYEFPISPLQFLEALESPHLTWHGDSALLVDSEKFDVEALQYVRDVWVWNAETGRTMKVIDNVYLLNPGQSADQGIWSIDVDWLENRTIQVVAQQYHPFVNARWLVRMKQE